jgi:hypothetical protein
MLKQNDYKTDKCERDTNLWSIRRVNGWLNICYEPDSSRKRQQSISLATGRSTKQSNVFSAT